jgi:hypothetical protein
MTTMRSTLLMSLMGLSLALGACDKSDAGTAKAGDAKAGGGSDELPEDVFDERVVKVAKLAKEIEADPTQADEILEKAGLDRPAFEALIFSVSTPELAEQYRLALAREEG